MNNQQLPEEALNNIDTLAHDLRNAMTVMYSYLQILERSLVGRDLDKEVKIVEDVLAEIREMDKMISVRARGDHASRKR